MKDRTLTRQQRRMPLMRRPILSVAEARAMLMRHREEMQLLSAMKSATGPQS